MSQASITIEGTKPVNLQDVAAALLAAKKTADEMSVDVQFALRLETASLVVTSGNSVYGLKLAKLFADPENEMAAVFAFLKEDSKGS